MLAASRSFARASPIVIASPLAPGDWRIADIAFSNRSCSFELSPDLASCSQSLLAAKSSALAAESSALSAVSRVGTPLQGESRARSMPYRTKQGIKELRFTGDLKSSATRVRGSSSRTFTRRR